MSRRLRNILCGIVTLGVAGIASGAPSTMPAAPAAPAVRTYVNEREIDRVLSDIAKAARLSSLNLRTMKALAADLGADRSELPIQMTLSGKFSSFYSFLLQFETVRGINDITQMKLHKSAGGELQVELGLSIFYQSDTSIDDHTVIPDKQSPRSAILREVGNSIPSAASLTDFSLDGWARITLNGIAHDRAEIDQIVANLSNSKLVRDVRLEKSRSDTAGCTFQIEMSLMEAK